jgi:hypothetical protein
MAENESIGGVKVDIVGDYSHLNGDIDAAVQVAAKGGEEIAAAFTSAASGADAISTAVAAAASSMGDFESQIAALVNSGSTLAEALAAVQSGTDAVATGVEQAGAAAATAAVQLDLFDQAIEVPYADAAGQLNMFATELEPIPGAAKAAAEAEQELAQASEAAGEAAHHAESGMSAMAEKLVQLGEALAIVEGLREFGLEAIRAADRVDDATIAIGALGKGAGEAKESIEKLRGVAKDEALSFPQLLQASTRMTAFLGSSEQVPPIMAAIGNSAQVMGVSLEASSRQFERIIESGKLGTRSLLALGISMDDVAKAMHTTADEAQKMFASLDQSEKVEVMISALGKFSGMAKKLNDDAGGAIHRLGLAWEEVMEDIGSALDPVIKKIGDFAETYVVPAVKAVTEAFKALPEPIRETAVVVGVLAAAAVPVTLAMGGLGLALTAAVDGLAPLVAGLVSLGGALTGAGASYTAMLATGIASAAVWAGLAVAIIDVGVAYVTMSRAQDQAAAAQAAAGKSLQEYELRLQQHGIDISAVKRQYDEGTLSTAQYISALGKLRDEYLKVHPVIQQHATATDAAGAASEGLKIKMQSLADAVASTRDHLAKVTEKYNEHKASANDVAKAYDAWQGATNALKSAQTALLPIVTNVHHATREFVETTLEFPSAAQAAADATDALQIKVGAESIALAEAQRWLDTVIQRYKDHNATAKDVAKALDLVNASQAALNKTLGDLPTITLKDFTAAMDKAGQTANGGIPALMAWVGTLAQAKPGIKDTVSLLSELGVKVSETGDLIQSKLIGVYRELGAHHVTLEEEAAAWGKVSGAVNKLAQTDLPAALKLYDEHYAQVSRAGAKEGELLELQAKRLQLEIAIDEQSGASATSQIIALEHIRLQQQALYDSTHLLGDMAVAVERDIEKGWSAVGNAITDDILEGKNFLKSMEDVGKQVTKMVMNELVGTAFKALKDSIVGVGGAIKEVHANWDSLHKAISDAVGGGAKDAAGAAKDLGGAAKGAGGAGGALGMVDAIASVGSLISNIISNVQFMHMNDSLKVIVNHTLVAANELMNLRADAWSQFNGMFDRIGEIWRDMRDGFQAVVDNIGNATFQAAGDAEATRSIFRGGMQDLAAAVDRGKGDAVTPAALPDVGPWNPYQPGSVPAGVWTSLTKPNASVPSGPSMSTPSAATYNTATTNQSSGGGTTTFNIYQATDPRETARQVADTMRTLSPRFAAYST